MYVCVCARARAQGYKTVKAHQFNKYICVASEQLLWFHNNLQGKGVG